VIFKVGGVHIENQLVNNEWVLTKPPCAYGLVGKQTVKHLLITACRLFEMDVVCGAIFDNVIVHVVNILPLIVALANTKPAAPVLRVSYYAFVLLCHNKNAPFAFSK
jgi:hypothetical protein